MEVLAKRLKWLRNQNRYTQKDIADKVGMSASGLQKIENNERDPKLDVLIKFCDIYNVSSDFLLGRNNETPQLKEVVRELYNSISEQDHLMKLINAYTMERIELEEDIRRLKSTVKLEEFENLADKQRVKDSLKFRKEYLERIEASIKDREKKYSENSKNVSDKLFTYLCALMELPESNPSTDEIIKKFIPYYFEIQPDIFGEYTIHLGGKGIGFIGHYGIYESADAATEKIEELKLILNGVQHENILR